jgi:hypothetical protein
MVFNAGFFLYIADTLWRMSFAAIPPLSSGSVLRSISTRGYREEAAWEEILLIATNVQLFTLIALSYILAASGSVGRGGGNVVQFTPAKNFESARHPSGTLYARPKTSFVYPASENVLSGSQSHRLCEKGWEDCCSPGPDWPWKVRGEKADSKRQHANNSNG